MNLSKNDFHKSIIESRRATTTLFVPYAFIWGVQWALNALLHYIWLWPYQAWLTPATAIPALILTLWVWIRQPNQSRVVISNYHTVIIVVMLLFISGAVIVLQYAQVIDPFFSSIFHSFVLCLIYIAIGGWLGSRWGISFVLLGLWLFLLTGIISIGYPGFASVVLGLFGGLSLMASGWIVHRWNIAFSSLYHIQD